MYQSNFNYQTNLASNKIKELYNYIYWLLKVYIADLQRHYIIVY